MIRTRNAVLAGALVLAAAAGSFAVWAATPAPPPAPTVARVTTRSFTPSIHLAGEIRFGELIAVSAHSAGTLTAVADSESTAGTGDVLFRVNGAPVVLLAGSAPVQRDLAQGAKGKDVLQLERNLVAMKYLRRIPDGDFEAPTTEAVKKWQRASGLPVTGVVSASSVVFVPEPARIGSTPVATGTSVEPGTTVVTLTARYPTVVATVPLASQESARLSTPVTVTLPDGTLVEGDIDEVGEPMADPSAETGSAGESGLVVPIEIALTDVADLSTLEEGPVTIEAEGDPHENVLAVPAAALLARPGGGVAVTIVTGGATQTTVPVTTGLSDGSLVEISGEGITDGTTVVTAPPETPS